MSKGIRLKVWCITFTDIFNSTGYGVARKNRLQALAKYVDLHLFAPFPFRNRFIEKPWFKSIQFHGLTDSINDIRKISWLFKYFRLILRIYDSIPKKSIIYTDSFLVPLLSIFFGKRYHFIIDYHGIWSKQLEEKGHLNRLFLFLVKIVEQRSLKQCFRIICVDRKIIDSLQQIVSITSIPIKHISNGVDIQHFNKNIKSRELKKQFRISDDDIVLFFSGSFRPWHGLDNLVDVLKQLSYHTKNFKMIFVGDGPDRKRIEQRCNQELPEHSVIFTDQVSYEDLPKYTSLADICLYFPKDILKKSRGYFGDPLKLYEWMAMSKAIITIDDPDLIYRFGKEPPMLTVSPNPGSFVDAIRHLSSKEKERNNLGKKGFDYVKHNKSWDITAKEIYKVISD